MYPKNHFSRFLMHVTHALALSFSHRAASGSLCLPVIGWPEETQFGHLLRFTHQWAAADWMESDVCESFVLHVEGLQPMQ